MTIKPIGREHDVYIHYSVQDSVAIVELDNPTLFDRFRPSRILALRNFRQHVTSRSIDEPGLYQITQTLCINNRRLQYRGSIGLISS